MLLIPENNTILDILKTNTDVSVFYELIKLAMETNEEVEELFGPMSDQNITIFVPINEAFQPNVTKSIKKRGYGEFILYHVIRGSILDMDLCGHNHTSQRHGLSSTKLSKSALPRLDLVKMVVRSLLFTKSSLDKE